MSIPWLMTIWGGQRHAEVISMDISWFQAGFGAWWLWGNSGNSMEKHGASWKINEDHVCFSGCPTLSASWGWLWRAAFFEPTESGIWTQHDPTLLEEHIIIATGFLLPVSSSRGRLVASAGVVNLKGEGFWEPPSARSFGWFLMMSEDFWWCLKIFADDVWRFLMMLEDFLMMFEDFEDTHKTDGMDAVISAVGVPEKTP